jgi:hypothetical protein
VSNGIIADPSGITQYTAVTFMNAGSEITINFCGDQQQLFPINAAVRADYTAGIFCSVLVRVVVDQERSESGDTACLQYKTGRDRTLRQQLVHSSEFFTTRELV